MKLIVGLGNPGRDYNNTRHNVGFNVIDLLVKKYGLSFNENKKYNAVESCFNLKVEKVIFVKPLTYMNLSGSSVTLYVNYYNIELSDILIIHDDLDMVLGKIRFVFDSSSGGHNGIKSIIAETGTQEIDRIKIGIGRPQKGMTVVNHVLGKFSEDDYAMILLTLDKVETALHHYLKTNDFEDTMRRYNG